MLSLAIKIDQSKLSHPEADIRYQLPVHLQQLTDGHLKDDGYDYLKDGTLVLFLVGDDESYVPAIIKALVEKEFLGNNLAEAISVGVDVGPGYTQVFPDTDEASFNLD